MQGCQELLHVDGFLQNGHRLPGREREILVARDHDDADAPVIQLVSNLFAEAHRMGASDIHLEPLDHKFQVRFRIDGVLREMPAAPKRMQSAIVSRLKIMTGSMSGIASPSTIRSRDCQVIRSLLKCVMMLVAEATLPSRVTNA